MFDTYKENEKWIANGSSNTGGKRDGYDIKLTKHDIDLLSNMRIVIDDNMNLHFYAGLVDFISSPYKASGMDYRIQQKDKTKLNEKIAALSSDKFKYDNKFVLVANDQMSFKETINGSFHLN